MEKPQNICSTALVPTNIGFSHIALGQFLVERFSCNVLIVLIKDGLTPPSNNPYSALKSGLFDPHSVIVAKILLQLLFTGPFKHVFTLHIFILTNKCSFNSKLCRKGKTSKR